jgi:hypothetical protein
MVISSLIAAQVRQRAKKTLKCTTVSIKTRQDMHYLVINNSFHHLHKYIFLYFIDFLFISSKIVHQFRTICDSNFDAKN